jgi:steroid 5-alpha reductase family enzyme
MTILYLEALGAIAVSLSMLVAGAFLVQQRTGNSGWVDTIWTFSPGLTGAGSAPWPVAAASGGRFSEKIVVKMKGVVT